MNLNCLLEKEMMEMVEDKVAAQDFEGYDLFVGQPVWEDADGNYINEDDVTPEFAKYLAFMGGKQTILEENK